MVTCSFDESFLQQPAGFLSAVSARITCENPHNGKALAVKMPEWVINPPPLVRPVAVGSQGFGGPVPISFSITWQRHTPTEGLGMKQWFVYLCSDGAVHFSASEEPDVLVIVLQDQLNSFLGVMDYLNQNFYDI